MDGRHFRESGNPSCVLPGKANWIPAFAGMTGNEAVGMRRNEIAHWPIARPGYGRVAASSRARIASASSRSAPHMARCGRRRTQTSGRSALPNTMHRLSSLSCTQRTPAGLPSGMPGIGDEIEGAMQQAPQPMRHCTAQCSGRGRSARNTSRTGFVAGVCPCQRRNDSAACSTSMPRPSAVRPAPAAPAQAMNGSAAPP